MIPSFLDGFNSTIFAYGATGAGKTHTMLGRVGKNGIIGYSFEEMFSKIEEERRTAEITVKVSFIEIYNEVLNDLIVQGVSEENYLDI